MGVAGVDVTMVACCQLAPVFGDPVANRELAAGAVTRAAEQGASVVVLPELVSSGYVFRSRAEAAASAEAADGPTVTGWARLAAEHQIVIAGGFCETAGGDLYNSAALVDPDGLRCVYRKAHLWDEESLWFTPGGAAPPVVATRFGQIAVMICYDLEFPEWVRLPALAGAQLRAPTNWPAFPRPARGDRAGPGGRGGQPDVHRGLRPHRRRARRGLGRGLGHRRSRRMAPGRGDRGRRAGHHHRAVPARQGPGQGHRPQERRARRPQARAVPPGHRRAFAK